MDYAFETEAPTPEEVDRAGTPDRAVATYLGDAGLADLPAPAAVDATTARYEFRQDGDVRMVLRLSLGGDGLWQVGSQSSCSSWDGTYDEVPPRSEEPSAAASSGPSTTSTPGSSTSE